MNGIPEVVNGADWPSLAPLWCPDGPIVPLVSPLSFRFFLFFLYFFSLLSLLGFLFRYNATSSFFLFSRSILVACVLPSRNLLLVSYSLMIVANKLDDLLLALNSSS